MALFCSKVKLIETDFFVGSTDYHSHILPSVDDGARCVTQTLEMLSYYEQLSVDRVVMTPHISMDYSRYAISHIEIFEEVKRQYNGRVQIHLAAEYMLDADFEGYISSGLRALFDNRVLVETSYAVAPFDMCEKLYRLSSLSYTPVIAHPERYLYMKRRDYDSLKNRGYELQLNLLSLAGAYGDVVRENALYILRRGMYDLCGSDMHNLDSFRAAISNIKLSRRDLDKLLEIKVKSND